MPLQQKIRFAALFLMAGWLMLVDAPLRVPLWAADPAADFRRKVQLDRPRIGCFTDSGLAADSNCKKFLELHAAARQLRKKHPDLYAKVLKAELVRIRSVDTYRYPPIFLAAILPADALRSELERIAGLEGKGQWRFRFAGKALERLKTGTCTEDGDRVYHDLCVFRDV